MARRLVLHIGYYKTGSTALQDQLHHLRSTLEEHGVLFPEAARPVKGNTSHSGLAFQELHQAGSHLPHWYRTSNEYLDFTAGEAAPAREALSAEIAASSADTVIVSSEEFVRFGSRQGVPVEQARDMVRMIGADRVTVVCYVRRPDRYLESWYNQLVKMAIPLPRLSVSMKREPHANHRYYGTEHTDFDRMIEYWASQVGCDDLVLRDYDDLVNGSILDDFFVAAELPTLGDVELAEVRPNPRIDNNFIEYARVWALFRPREPNGQLTDLLARMAKQPDLPRRSLVYVLDPGARRRLLRYVEPINERLGKMSGWDHGFFDEIEDLLEIPEKAMSDIEAFRFWAPYIDVAVRATGIG